MSTYSWKVFVRCPSCGLTKKHYDLQEKESGETRYCIFFNRKFPYECPYCNCETPNEQIFTKKNCQVEDISVYSEMFRERIRFVNDEGLVPLASDIPEEDYNQEPALSRLMKLYPDDRELQDIGYIYKTLKMYGTESIHKFESNNSVITRNMMRVPEAITKVYLGNSVERIEDNTFEDCKSLRDVFLPDSVRKIGDNAFARSGLSKIHVSKGLKVIGKRAFVHTWLSKFFFPDELESIGEECFAECSCLDNLWIPPQTVVGRNAFVSCDRLKCIHVAKSVSQEVIDTWGLPVECMVERY